MRKHLYVDNFKCQVDFSIEFDELPLLHMQQCVGALQGIRLAGRAR